MLLVLLRNRCLSLRRIIGVARDLSWGQRALLRPEGPKFEAEDRERGVLAEGQSPLHQLGACGLGKRCKVPSWVWGGDAFWMH